MTMKPFEPKGRVEFEVVGGMCRLQFDPAVSCGPDEGCNPGVGFGQISDSEGFRYKDGKIHSGMGVFSRADAARLRDMLNEFLEAYPVPKGDRA
jgi:hypothetical protein